MADGRTRMKSKSTFDNPLIINHTKPRENATTVQDGDEFSTHDAHADQLEQTGLAERISGDAADATEAQVKLLGTQTPAAGAIVTNRQTKVVPNAPAKV